MSGLVIKNLTVRFDDHVAVDAVDLTVAAGSVFALVGPSGCGKSTLLRSVAGLVEPDSGSIEWEGGSLARVPVHQRGIGLMFQNHALFGHRSVAENIEFGLRMAGVDEAARRARVSSLLDQVGLAGFADRSVHELSGGEAQRVALARALAPEPRLLLLDEPLASLDRARREALNDELGRLLRELGQTAVYVTHDQHEAFAIADAVGVMDRGQLHRVGTPHEVWRDPQSEFVARFVGHEVIDHGGQRVAVRSDAVTVLASPDSAAIAAVVQRCVFEGDRWRVTVGAASSTLTAWSPTPFTPGEAVSIHLDESRLAVVPRP